MSLLRRGHKEKLRPLDEAEAYARCYGGRDDDVRIVKIEPRRPRYDFGPSGERLREAFEQRLDTREPEAEAEITADDAEVPADEDVETPPSESEQASDRSDTKAE